MARDRANINTSIWTDQDFRDLNMAEQHLYKLLMTHPTLTYAGVVDWRPARIAAMTADATAEGVRCTAESLQAKRYVFIDEETEEILVRSFLRHDGLLKQPKLSISMVNAFGAVASKRIREVVTHELQRLFEESPEWAAFTQPKVQALLKGKGTDMSEFTDGLTPDVTLPFTLNAAQAQALPTSTATSTSTKKDSSSEVSDETPRPDVIELLDLLDTCLEQNGFKKPSRTKKNTDAARLLIDKDGYDVKQVSWMIRWATNDEFWRTNILSMSKLREKFDQLKAKAGVGNGPKPAPGFNGEIDVDAILGRDIWTPPAPPAGLSVAEEIEWKKQQRAEHNAERLEQAKKKLGAAA